MRAITAFCSLALWFSAGAQGGGCQGNEPIADLAGPSTIRTCQNGTVQFDASSSTVGNGTTILSYQWDFGDGETVTVSTPYVEHTYSAEGQYSLELMITNDVGCASINALQQVVQVATTPDFSDISGGGVVCPGGTAFLGGLPVPTIWTNEALFTTGEGVFLPDENGVPFLSTVEVSGDIPDATVTELDDIPSVCVEMEHSYMGDLSIELICPNGQSIFLHQQGGGATYLGVPVDDEGTLQGECWTYCWSPFASSGTWADNAGGTLPGGTYESVEPFSGLFGCPLNGTWTLRFIDLFASDNGYLCSWELSLTSASFIPDLGLELDSSGWSGPGAVLPTTGGAIVTPPAAGTFTYQYSVLDNFGCVHDTSIVVTVPDLEILEIEAPVYLPPSGLAIFTVLPELPDADSISWEPLPEDWSWSVSDTDPNDGTAILYAPESGNYTVCAQAFGDGCAGPVICTALGVGLEDHAPGTRDFLIVYPDPSYYTISVKATDRFTNAPLEVLDATGRVLIRSRLMGTQADLGVAHLAEGHYHVRCMIAEHRVQRAFVVLR